MTQDVAVHRLLWAKAQKGTDNFHRLIYHLIDVGTAARTLWDVVTSQIRADLIAWSGLDALQAGHLFPFWAALHDLGKASPAFQYHPSLSPDQRQVVMTMLAPSGLHIPAGADQAPPRHEVITTWALKYEPHLQTLPGLSAFIANLVGQALGGHHGHWPGPDRLDAVLNRHRGDSMWTRVRHALVDELIDLFQPPDAPALQRRRREDNIAMTLFSGFVTLADWIASNSDFFPYEHDPTVCLQDYLERSRGLAHQAFVRIGWHTQPAVDTFDFVSTFGFERNVVQQTIHHELAARPAPTLALIELPMGGGKTEAGQDTFVAWSQQQGTHGLYVAMPTMATSNQMHQRTSVFLKDLFGPAMETLLIHSAALLQRDDLRQTTLGQPVEDQVGERAADLTWFLPSKKSLLAPFGVGTVDQTLLGVLQTKHSFLRLFALSHKVVIFDEVHAYDCYMSALFERLLTWLRAVHCSVVILSATLPQQTRQRLMNAYAGQHVILPDTAYPRVTWTDGSGAVGGCTLPTSDPQTLTYAWIDATNEAIATCLRRELQHGGCAAVICNTVARAQEVYLYLSQSDLAADPDNLLLFHGRTPLYWRQRTEARVLERFGPGNDKRRPNPLRPAPGQRVILVATQVIEQSLDLDFDVMISELAPIDLLIQRSGRLHRHAVNHARRPVRQRCLWIAVAPEAQGLPALDRRTRRVYAVSVLYRTWLTLTRRSAATIAIPADLQTLIDTVYGNQELPDLTDQQRERLQRAKHQLQRNENDERNQAKQCMVDPPESLRYLYHQTFNLNEDDPTVHRSLRALTRSGAPGIKAVCLHRRAGQLWLDADDEDPEERCALIYDPAHIPDAELIRTLNRRVVSIDREDVQAALLALDDQLTQTIRARWQRIPALRYAQVLVFDGGICQFAGFRLHLDRTLGLQIERINR
jgi:CRISPR-associated endonuclease/helicase Cas3